MSREQFARHVERSVSLESLIDQAWEAFEAGDNARVSATWGLCRLSLDHGRALRLLVQQVPGSSITLLRPQFEALVRSFWAIHVATDADINRLLAPLTLESQRAAKKLPPLSEMLESIQKSDPRGAGAVLGRARTRLTDGMNSFIHGGIHPFRRGQDGYPIPLLANMLEASNAMSVLTLMVLVEMTDDIEEVTEFLRALVEEFEDILPEIEPLGPP
jgi:hypothetical protein